MVLEKFNLEGKVAVITGAGGNLGNYMAQALAGAGADVAVSDFRAEPLEKTATDVRKLGRKSTPILADITDSRQVNNIIARTIEEFGKIDIMINNAGIVRGYHLTPIEAISDEDWRIGIDTNLSGAFYCCRALSLYFQERKKGKVINVASGFGLVARRDHYTYCCAKAGVILLTKSLALSWAQAGINVNCIAPGFFGKPVANNAAEEKDMSTRASLVPVGYSGRYEDMGNLAVFLASEASDYITGEVFSIDGGALADGFAPSGFAPVIPMTPEGGHSPAIHF